MAIVCEYKITSFESVFFIRGMYGVNWSLFQIISFIIRLSRAI